MAARPLSITDYERLPHTQALFKERLRLCPPAYFLVRTSLEDLTLGDCFISRGINVQSVIRLLLLDEKHVPHARGPLPERWLEESADDIPRHTHIPCGFGHRLCVAWIFGLMQGTLFLPGLA